MIGDSIINSEFQRHLRPIGLKHGRGQIKKTDRGNCLKDGGSFIVCESHRDGDRHSSSLVGHPERIDDFDYTSVLETKPEICGFCRSRVAHDGWVRYGSWISVE
jgi:hypothetical protein